MSSLDASADDERRMPHTLAALLDYLWPASRPALKVRVALALVFLIAAKIVGVFAPVVYREIVNALDAAGQSESIILGLVVSYGLAKFMQTLFGELRDLVFVGVAQYAKRALGLETFRHLHDLSLRFHLERQTGGLSRVIERGTSGIQFFLSFMLFNIVPSCIELLLVCALLAYYFNILYALVTFGTVVLYIALTLALTEWRLKYRRVMNERDELANTRAVDSLLNYETVKYFGNEKHEYQSLSQVLETYEEAAIASQRSLLALNLGQSAIISVGTIVLLWMAYRSVLRHELDLGSFVMINTYMMQLFIPLNFLGFVYRQMKQSIVDMDKMFEVKSQPQDVRDDENALTLKVDEASIAFHKVSFGYDRQRIILRDFDVTIPAGQTVAIVGESGAGKSTLVRLLYRFFDVDAGSITIAGVDIRRVRQDSLRAHIGIVPQDTVLFNDSIRYNLLYGRLSASDDELQRACQLAQIDRFIAQLPDGLDTRVGERGLKLSGGEKQRIAIARTILKDPPILILDEATSSLDSKTEKEIERALAELTRGRTTLVIAHRLSTVVNADKILVLKAGRIVEAGRHQQLLAGGGEYYQMWQRQKETQANAEPTTAEEGHKGV